MTTTRLCAGVMLAALLWGCGPAGGAPGDDAGNAATDASDVDSSTAPVDGGVRQDSSVRHDARSGSDARTGSDAARRDAAVGDARPGIDGASEVDAAIPVGTELNPGWIGGACQNAGSCTYASATCEATDFPAGMCTQACSQSSSTGRWICPDQASPVEAPYTTTRCISDDADQPRCVAQCDFTQSASGCRPGYSCVLRQRHGQADAIFPVCLPTAAQGWPGQPLPAFDIGGACGGHGDCGYLQCLNQPGGYCTKSMCATAGCPAGSTCFRFEGSDDSYCLRDCNNTNQCRASAGYWCDSQDDVCWPDPTVEPARWDSSVGAADCAAQWSNLSTCDTSHDDYLVVRKSARNMALCHNGALVQNFQTGLTPDGGAIGDKVREGDGKTPEGVFYVAQLVDPSTYYKALLISYPDAADAARGVSSGLINQTVADSIVEAQQNCTVPPQTTALGSYVEVHGCPSGYAVCGDQDWTVGCMATDNTNIDAIYAVMGVGDSIVILP